MHIFLKLQVSPDSHNIIRILHVKLHKINMNLFNLILYIYNLIPYMRHSVKNFIFKIEKGSSNKFPMRAAVETMSR